MHITIEAPDKLSPLQRRAAAAPLTSLAISKQLATTLADRINDTKKVFSSVIEIVNDVPFQSIAPEYNTFTQHHTINPATIDLEGEIPEQPKSSLVFSHMAMPFVRNHRQFLLNLGKMLKGDGLLLVNTLGPASFPELRHAFAAAGSHTPHINMLPDVKDLGNTLAQLQFAMPVADRDIITLHYPSLSHILGDLKISASTNSHPARRRGLCTQHLFEKIEHNYPKAPDGTLPVTLEVITLSAWRPHKNQQQPLQPGCAKMNIAEAISKIKIEKGRD